jgi:hypothetical protein
MADVAQKVISGNGIYNNRSVVATNPKNGTVKLKSYGENKYVDVAVLETRYDARYDDRVYYSN